jgi:hypothetical protein
MLDGGRALAQPKVPATRTHCTPPQNTTRDTDTMHPSQPITKHHSGHRYHPPITSHHKTLLGTPTPPTHHIPSHSTTKHPSGHRHHPYALQQRQPPKTHVCRSVSTGPTTIGGDGMHRLTAATATGATTQPQGPGPGPGTYTVCAVPPLAMWCTT